MFRVKVDISGQRFGRLVAVRETDQRIDKSVVWECLCDCGEICLRSQGSLRAKRTTSCGCKRREILKFGNPSHGMSYTRTHRIWAGMLARCLTPSMGKTYEKYGGAGISVCAEWRSFATFLADMGECPSDGHSIDRYPNQSGNYEPGNCRWATLIEQQNNRKSNRVVEIDGQTKTVSQWSRIYGIRPLTAIERMRRGWPEQAAITTPLYGARP